MLWIHNFFFTYFKTDSNTKIPPHNVPQTTLDPSLFQFIADTVYIFLISFGLLSSHTFLPGLQLYNRILKTKKLFLINKSKIFMQKH